jgi:hypothetical protein
MNVTAEQVFLLISEIESAVRQGIQTGNIRGVMKAQKLAMVSDRHPFGRTN